MSQEAQQENLVSIGSVGPEVAKAVRHMNERCEALTHRLGSIELQKAAVVAEITRVQGSIQRMLKAEADRLGIPNGQQWQLQENGEALVHPKVAEAIAALTDGEDSEG